MKKLLTYLAILVVVLTFDQGAAQDNLESVARGLSLTGFFDIISSYQAVAIDNGRYALNQAELDIEKELSRGISVEAAIAYDDELKSFGIGAAIIDMHPFGEQGEHLHPVLGITHSGIMAGKFDVPFGIEWQEYASIDRKLISTPEIVEATHEEWNDIGIQLYAENSKADISIYGVNGFESMAETTWMKLNLETNLYEEQIDQINTTPDNAFGGRIGIKPLTHLEVGASYAWGINKSHKPEMTLKGLDCSFDDGIVNLKSEYIEHEKNRSISKETTKGYYIQGSYQFGKPFAVLRLCSLKDDQENVRHDQLSFGCGYSLSERAEVRCEYSVNSGAVEDVLNFQLAVGFCVKGGANCTVFCQQASLGLIAGDHAFES